MANKDLFLVCAEDVFLVPRAGYRMEIISVLVILFSSFEMAFAGFLKKNFFLGSILACCCLGTCVISWFTSTTIPGSVSNDEVGMPNSHGHQRFGARLHYRVRNRN